MTNRRWLQTFFLLLILPGLAVVALCAATVSVVRSSAFPGFMLNPLMPTIDSAFRRHDPPCQVLIYGDSTAITGESPEIISAATGLRTCSIAVPVPVVSLQGTTLIDAYLERNPAPRFIVLHLAPENFWGSHVRWEDSDASYTEAILIRHSPLATTVSAMLRHPIPTALFVQRVLLSRLHPSRAKVLAYHDTFGGTEAQYARTGLVTMGVGPETRCIREHVPPSQPPDLSWVQDARRRFAKRGILFLVKPSSLPDCENDAAFFNTSLAAILDRPVLTRPIGEFTDYDRHFTQAGARVQSLETAALILDRERTGQPATRP